MRPVNTVKGLGCDDTSALVGALAVALLWLVSIEAVLETLEEDVADARRFFASSRGTLGPPARLHATPCLTQLEQGASSLHFTCLLLHWAQPLRLFLWPTRGARLG